MTYIVLKAPLNSNQPTNQPLWTSNFPCPTLDSWWVTTYEGKPSAIRSPN